MKRATILSLALVCVALLIGGVLAQSNSTAEQLYQKWSQNNRTEHSVAYEAAKEYLKRFPTGKYAQQLTGWVGAYEKIINQVNPPTVVPPNNEQAAIQREAGLKEMLELLKTYIEEHGVDGPRYGVLGSRLPKMLYRSKTTMQTQVDTNICMVKIVSVDGAIIDEEGKEMYRWEYTIPLDKVDPDTVHIDPNVEYQCCDAGGEKLLGRPIFMIVMMTRGNEKIVSCTMRVGHKITKSGNDCVGAFILLTGREVAFQVRDAFKRVVSLCAGR